MIYSTNDSLLHTTLFVIWFNSTVVVSETRMHEFNHLVGAHIDR